MHVATAVVPLSITTLQETEDVWRKTDAQKAMTGNASYVPGYATGKWFP
jgi:hypothetical protein